MHRVKATRDLLNSPEEGPGVESKLEFMYRLRPGGTSGVLTTRFCVSVTPDRTTPHPAT